MNEIPSIIIEADDLKSLEFAIVENVQRHDLNPIEVSNNVSLTLSYDELYHMSRLYETLLETDYEFHPLVDDVFIKILEAK